ncbi:MAG: hypothetical protein V1745_05055 [Patescibacteria group bacterium]
MKVEDIVVILNNRLREFKLSKDYATMSGDLSRINDADKEIIDLEDTLYKLNLLVDASKSDLVKMATLAEVITDGSVSVLGEYDITSYATDPLHEEKIMYILSKMGVMDSAEKIEDYIKSRYPSSPVSGEMVMTAASAYSVDTRLLMAMMEQDSSFGTAGKAVRTLNPGNVGNDDSGNLRTYESWQEGVTAVASWLSRHRGSTTVSDVPPVIPAEAGTQNPPPEDPFPVTTSTTPPVVPAEAGTPPDPVPPAEDPLPVTSSTTTTIASTEPEVTPPPEEPLTAITTTMTTTTEI